MPTKTAIPILKQPPKKESLSISHYLEIADFFLSQTNRNRKFEEDWTFDRIDSLLRQWVLPFYPEAESASFEKIVLFLKELTKESQTEITVPTELLTEMQEALDQAVIETGETSQRSAEQAEREITTLYKNWQKRLLIQKLTQPLIDPQIQAKIANGLSENLRQELEGSYLSLLTEKLESLPPDTEEHRQLQRDIDRQLQEKWQQAVVKTSQENDLAPEETSLLQNLPLSALEIAKPDEYLTEIGHQKNQIEERIKVLIPPSDFSPEEIAEIAGKTSEKLVEEESSQRAEVVSISPAKASQETETKIKESLSEVVRNLGKPEKAETLHQTSFRAQPVSDISLFLENIRAANKKQTERISRILSPALTPEKASFMLDQLIQPFSDTLAQTGSPTPTSQELEEAAVAALWQLVGTEVRIQPAEIPKIIDTLTNLTSQETTQIRKLSSFNRPGVQPSLVKPLQLKDETGLTMVEKIRKNIGTYGININPKNDSSLLYLRYRAQAAVLIFQGITSKDIEKKIDQLRKKGYKENSPQIKELQAVNSEYEKSLQFLKQNGFSNSQLLSWIKKGNSSVNLVLSRFNTLLTKSGFGQNIKISLGNTFRNWFLKSPFGKPIKLALEKSAQKSLQALWSAGKEGIKKAIVPALTKILTTLLGIGVKAAAVLATNIVGLALIILPKLLKFIKDRFKNIISKGARIINSLFSGLTGSSETSTGLDSKWLMWLIAGLFIFLIFSGSAGDMSKNSAFLAEKGSRENLPIRTVPLECLSPRHLAEETICLLSKGTDPCNQKKVNQNTWNKVNSCFSQILLQEKEIIRTNFEYSTNAFNSLQCVGFVKGIQAALGAPIDTAGNAKDYLTLIPTGYVKIEGTSLDIKKGDIAIWKGNTYGHMAIVVEIIEPAIDTGLGIRQGQLVAAQAWGTENTSGGTINLSTYFFGNPLTDQRCPDGYLRKQ